MTLSEDLQSCLRLLPSTQGVSPLLASLALQVWLTLEAQVAGCPVPRVEEGEEPGGLKMLWSQEGFYLDLDLYEENHEWFYHDRKTGAYTGTEVPVEGPLDPQFLAVLAQAFASPSPEQSHIAGGSP